MLTSSRSAAEWVKVRDLSYKELQLWEEIG